MWNFPPSASLFRNEDTREEAEFKTEPGASQGGTRRRRILDSSENHSVKAKRGGRAEDALEKPVF